MLQNSDNFRGKMVNVSLTVCEFLDKLNLLYERGLGGVCYFALIFFQLSQMVLFCIYLLIN